MSSELWKLWAQFARDGRPCPEWKPCTRKQPLCMDLKLPPKLENFVPYDNLKFWDELLREKELLKSKL
jgi:hypothetical protein